MNHPKEERTLVLIKPDGVARGLIGEILTRFESRGLKILALKMVHPSREHAAKHYSGSEEWIRGMGQRVIEGYTSNGLDPAQELGTTDTFKIGQKVQEWNVDYLSMGPVVAVALQGMHAVTTARKLVGNTIPVLAEPGTIRGDYSIDSGVASNIEKRTVRNVVHASGNIEEAENEINHWFKADELVKYTRADEEVMFS